MKNFSNTYIYVFSIIMIVTVATLLAVVANVLKPKQELNVKIEQMQNILSSVEIESDKKDVEANFNKYIIDSYIINSAGEKIEGDAVNVDLKEQVSLIEKINQLYALKKEKRVSPFKKFVSGIIAPKETDLSAVDSEIESTLDKRKLPVYVCNKDADTLYIIPLRGKGLWGPVWGYLALESDFNTLYGAVFDHKSETPGLGAEINTDWFESAFKGKKLFENDEFVSIEVAKGGNTQDNIHAVDAISGGTITSKGVEAMITDCLQGYLTFFDKQKN